MFSPPVEKTLKGSPGPGFFGKTSSAITGGCSSIGPAVSPESDFWEVTILFFPEELLLHDAMQLIIKRIIKNNIRLRLLTPAIDFITDIFDLKIA
jgi:hypothetical protein